MRWIALFLFCGIPLAGWACSCAPAPKISETDVLAADLVFIGQIISTERTDRRLIATFRVSERLISARRQKEIQIETALNSAACGLSFQENAYWYIWAAKMDNGNYVSNNCSRSAPLRDPRSIPANTRVASELAYFKSRKKVKGPATVSFPESRRSPFPGGKATGTFCKGLPKGEWNYYDSKGILRQRCSFDRKLNERTCTTVLINQ